MTVTNSLPDLDVEKRKCRQFLDNFTDGDDIQPKYKSKLLKVANREMHTICVSLDDVAKFFEDEDDSFVTRIQWNAKRYIKLFSDVADELMPAPTRTDIPWDLWDEFMSQAQERYLERKKAQMNIALANPAPTLNLGADLQEEKSEWELPASLRRRFELQIKPLSSTKFIPLREVNAQHVGHLIKIAVCLHSCGLVHNPFLLKGVVAQVSDVRPLVRVATYVDVQNGTDYYQEVVGKTFIPLHQAPQKPDQAKISSQLEFLKDHSKFVSFQEIKVQENQDEVPEGTTPRSLKFTLIGDLTRRVKPGDQIVISGICIAQPFSGTAGARPGLLASSFVETMDLQIQKLSYSVAEVSNEELQLIQELSSQGNIYGRLAQSIAPEIHGHTDVKKRPVFQALLLMMVAGVTNETKDGMKLRGDIHICLMGDPGVAKSQLLKFIAYASPRSVYTTGKGSSGVGLTASIVREEKNHEACLEGGALVLADQGICCIDEFDKMEEADRTAIHEVMEQQTVSIAKAGITTTLNARTTILAAANPAWGRYNSKKTPAENIALPPALLSRFDIMWLILDKPDASKDRSLSEHILHVHCHGNAPYEEGLEPLTDDQLRAYVTAARTFKPIIPNHLIDYIANVYAAMRQENLDHKRAHTYTTPRTLMSILRMSQALAKLQFRSEVIQDDVEEALRLMQMSKISLIEEDRRGDKIDPISAIYQKMNAYWKSSLEAKQNGISFGKIRELCSGMKLGSRNEKIRECIEEYCELGIINVGHGDDGEPIVFFVCQ